MRRVFGRIVVALVVVMAVVVGPVALGVVAYADPYGSPGGTISVADPAAGSSVTVTGSGFRPDSAVTVQILSTPVWLASVTADGNGVATAQVRIPAGFAAGSSHTIQLVGENSSSAAYVVSIPVTVASAGTALPKTGTTLAYLGLGLVALAVGVFLVVVVRRRRAATR